MCGAKEHDQTNPVVRVVATHVNQRGLDVGVVGEGHDLVDVAPDGVAADRQGQLRIGELFCDHPGALAIGLARRLAGHMGLAGASV